MFCIVLIPISSPFPYSSTDHQTTFRLTALTTELTTATMTTPKDLTLPIAITYGALTPVIGKTLIAPLDRIRLLLQTNTTPTHSILSTARLMYARDGLRGLFKGHLYKLAKIVPQKAVTFGSLSITRSSSSSSSSSSLSHAAIGAAAGTLAALLTHPLDCLRVRSGVTPIGTPHLPSSLAPLTRGIGLSVAAWAAYSAVFFPVFRALTAALTPHAQEGESQTPGEQSIKSRSLAAFAAAASAGVLAQIVAYPIDTLRRRIQAPGGGSLPGPARLALSILASEGYPGLYRGVSLVLSRIPAMGFSFALYQLLEDHIAPP